MRIAIATDFSDQAERARESAVALALRLHASSITLIHALEPYPYEPADDARLVDTRRQLERAAAEIRARGLFVQVELARGDATEETIAATALRLGAALLVIGTHGRRAPLRWILGSVAERTLMRSAIPVLVIGDGADGLSAWAARDAGPLRVTVAVQSAEEAEPILEVSRLFAGAGGCQLTFIHVASRALLAGGLESLLSSGFRARLAGLDAQLRIVPADDSPVNAVAAYLAEHPCDLSVVGIHPRSDFEFPRTAELARALLHRRIVPVLAVPLAPAGTAAAEAPPALASILAPTDLSALGNRAVAFAYAIARGGAVTLLHVYLTRDGEVAPFDAGQRAELERRLLALVPADAQARHIVTHAVVVEGAQPAQAIVDAATRLGSEVICLASRHRTTLGRALLGSVTETVIDRFGRAVLLVR